MTAGVYLRVVGIWLLILVCAVLNGALREMVFLPNLPRTLSFVLSGVLLSVCVLGVAGWLIASLGVLTSGQYWGVGALWVAMTLAFEFGFGGWVRGLPWQELLGAYTFKDGNIWPLVLVVVFIAPYCAARFKGLARASKGQN